MQVILTKSSPVVFANYSLVEKEERVSDIAAVQSDESLLFVVGNKVPVFCCCLSLSPRCDLSILNSGRT